MDGIHLGTMACSVDHECPRRRNLRSLKGPGVQMTRWQGVSCLAQWGVALTVAQMAAESFSASTGGTASLSSSWL